ncbi:MAG: hypothetical protein M5R36_13905 [Deltaproteobacteria bacterium]|nr:hypothetical protein [Deltaproteobacteria bacterium]
MTMVTACGKPPGGVIMDFEDEADLDRLLWKCHATFERTEAISGHGRYALTAKLFPEELYPGVEFFDPPRDWRGYRAFAFTVYAPDAAGETLHIRIDDNPDDRDFEGRYQGYVKLTGAVQHVEIPLDEIRNQPPQGPLSLGTIRKLVIYLYNQDKPRTLVLDDLRLVGP